MASTPKVFAEGQDISSTAAQIVPVPTGTVGWYLDKLNTMNYSGSAVTVTLWLVPSGGSTLNANKQVSVNLTAGASYSWPEISGAFMVPGSSLWAQCSAATSANIRISGREIT